MPSDDFLSEKVGVIRERFGIVDSVLGTVEVFSSFFERISDSEPPVIELDLGLAESDFNYGGKVSVLDLTWYARFKPTVDTFLSSMIWVFFVWRVFKKLPAIINGLGVD